MDALAVFLKNQEEAKNYLRQYGDDGVLINKGVTLSYANIAKIDPLFIWFSAAVLGSHQVGKSIALASLPVLNYPQSAQTFSRFFLGKSRNTQQYCCTISYL